MSKAKFWTPVINQSSSTSDIFNTGISLSESWPLILSTVSLSYSCIYSLTSKISNLLFSKSSRFTSSLFIPDPMILHFSHYLLGFLGSSVLPLAMSYDPKHDSKTLSSLCSLKEKQKQAIMHLQIFGMHSKLHPPTLLSNPMRSAVSPPFLSASYPIFLNCYSNLRLSSNLQPSPTSPRFHFMF